jgi:hypothetical protein
VVSVVEDIHYDGLDAAAGGAVYVPWNQLPLGVVYLVDTEQDGCASATCGRCKNTTGREELLKWAVSSTPGPKT